jgi:uncharacterized protein
VKCGTGSYFKPSSINPQPALIFHGTDDSVVPYAYSEEYAAHHPNVRLRLLKSDHQLTDVTPVMWEETAEFLF